jgi:two-component system KDP operon response regulator KdpE
LSKPDLVVLDLGLPDMDGQQVLRELREWSTVPVMVLSVRASEVQKVDALDGGANDYVTKPFGIQEFLARVRALLRQAPQVGSATSTASLGRWWWTLPFAGDAGGAGGGADAQGIRVAGAAGRAPGAGDYPAAVAQGYLGADPYRGHPLPADVVGHLRQKLGDDPTAPRFIITEAGVGYRLVAPAI